MSSSRPAVRFVQVTMTAALLALVGGCDVPPEEGALEHDEAAATLAEGTVTEVSLPLPPKSFAAAPLAAGIWCETQGGDSSFGARCFFQGPTLTQYRAVATCTGGRTAVGGWFTVNSGIWSWANCPRNSFVISRFIQTR